MKTRTLCGALILAGLMAVAAPSHLSLAQSNAPVAPASTDEVKGGAKGATKIATPNTNMTPTKHRYWRHRGGTHPHFGSRRVRTQSQAQQKASQ